MNVRYTLVAWEFNRALWAKIIGAASDEFGSKEFAEMVGVGVKTLSTWQTLDNRDEFAYPNMTNFMKVVNLLDLTPSDFFVLEDK